MSNLSASMDSRLRSVLLAVFAGLLCLGMAGCAKVYVRTGLYYRMQSGDSLTSLARTYGVTVQELAEINDIEDSKDLKPGDRVFIPTRARKTKTVKPLAKGVAEEKIVFDRGRFAWPIHGRLTSRFGMRNGTRHDGIDIASPHGTPIHAASAGQVVYSQRLRGYGHLILVKHKDGFFTAYAHLSQYLVKKGKRVKKGQVIGKVGATGRATGPHLHFEVRKGRVARNPLFFLPKL